MNRLPDNRTAHLRILTILSWALRKTLVVSLARRVETFRKHREQALLFTLLGFSHSEAS